MTRDDIKAVRRVGRAGQVILRRRGGPHGKRGYQRPHKSKELDQ